jgi:hypothetical protein
VPHADASRYASWSRARSPASADSAATISSCSLRAGAESIACASNVASQPESACTSSSCGRALRRRRVELRLGLLDLGAHRGEALGIREEALQLDLALRQIRARRGRVVADPHVRAPKRSSFRVWIAS